MIAQYLPKILIIERKNRNVSIGVTLLMVILFLFLCFFWYAMRSKELQAEEQLMAVVGVDGIGDGGGAHPDFGDGREGGQNVNNFDPAVANPTPGKMNNSGASSPPPAPAATTPPAKADAKQDLTSDEDSHTTAPPTAPKKDDKKNPKPATTATATTATTPPKTSTTPPKTTSSQANTGTSTGTSTSTGGGSNHGNNPGGVGNAGNPDIKTLDPDGIYDFGSGGGTGGGLGNRKPISLAKPRYDVQEEGKVTFEFVITPDGNVPFVKALPSNKLKLKELGIEAIQKWKFSKLPPNAEQKNQTLRVTITFKLKG